MFEAQTEFAMGEKRRGGIPLLRSGEGDAKLL